jgi:cell division transport system ATP-binding protein
MNQPIINLQDISIVNGSKTLLEDINLNIFPGELVYLTGMVGSGKTSLLKTLYAELKPSAGQAYVSGINVHNIKRNKIPFLRRELGIVFQDFQLLPDRDVHDNLQFVLEATGWKNEEDIAFRIKEVLEEVGLKEKEFSYPHELSGGEQQRIVIARALLNKPSVVLADEPTGNLDPESSYRVMEILKKITDSGSCVLIATHQYDLIDKYPGKVLKIENKTLLEHNKLDVHAF